MLFNLGFVNNTILSYFFFFSLVIDLYFLNSCGHCTIFNTIAELIIPIKISSKETKAEIEMHPVIVEAKIRTCSI